MAETDTSTSPYEMSTAIGEDVPTVQIARNRAREIIAAVESYGHPAVTTEIVRATALFMLAAVASQLEDPEDYFMHTDQELRAYSSYLVQLRAHSGGAPPEEEK